VGSASDHWNATYEAKAGDEVSWFEASPKTSLSLIDRAGLDSSAAVIDIGGGMSHLAAALLGRGFRDVSVLDVSSAALAASRSAHAREAARITWIEADVRTYDFDRRYELWHDRAVFHFLVDAGDRAAYLAALGRSLAVGGWLILATFGPEGPASCSGLPVRRYSAEQMADELGRGYDLHASELVAHRTPRGAEQQFQYALFRRSR
jgi:trans-aconitate methyltransferase